MGYIAENRPKLLIIGHARHGKDTVAEMLRDQFGMTFKSSSHYVGEKAVWPMWGKDRYETFEQMFEDRINHRELWSNLINAYNTPDLTRTGREMIQQDGYDMYVGMRDDREYQACMQSKIFNYVVWVDASKRLPPEDNPKMKMTAHMANYTINNNGNLDGLDNGVDLLVKHLFKLGYHWQLPEPDFEEDFPDFVDTHSYVPGPRQAVAEIPQIMPSAQPEAVSAPDEVDLMIVPDGATQVLDHGYVVLMDTFGTDADICEAARLSYGRGTTKVNKNEGLIKYLYSNHHTSPFEMAEMKFQMRLPIFIMRQWVRHRTANLNEYSGRYSVMPRLWYTPDVHDILGQDTVNKQGSSEALPYAIGVTAQKTISDLSSKAFDKYEEMLEMGVSREMARIVLPLNTYTEIVWKMDLNNMLKFLWLRDDSHAQPEIQAYAQVIARMVEEKFPLVYVAYLESRRSYTLSQPELLALMTGDRSALSASQTRKSITIQEELKAWMKEQMLNNL